MTYPTLPGCKISTGPSVSAARAMTPRSKTLREAVEELLETEDLTADECADILGESILAIRPRFSELRALGKLVDTGRRRPNASGHQASVWRLVRVPAGQLALL